MAEFDEQADLMATLGQRLHRAESRLGKAMHSLEMAQCRAVAAQSIYDQIKALYAKARNDVLAAAKERAGP